MHLTVRICELNENVKATNEHGSGLSWSASRFAIRLLVFAVVCEQHTATDEQNRRIFSQNSS